jgi:glycine dehydrogenase subunit 1
MNYGGGQSGFIATIDDPKYVMEYPSRLFGICPTSVPGEYAFGDVAYDRTSFGHHRHEAKEFVGTQTALWGITAGVYLSLMGPCGMSEVGETIM